MANSFLPHGLQLKSLLVGSLLTDADLKRFLHERGIYISSSDKDVTVPIITSLLLSPNEFEKLKINQVSHEDTVKQVTRWMSTPNKEFSLLEALESLNLDESILPLQRNYEVVGAPSFRGNPTTISMDIEIVRENPQKSWVDHNSNHKAQVDLEKHEDKVKVTLKWTTPETKEIANALALNVRQQFIRRGMIDNNVQLRTVNAGSFTNEERIKKLLAFTSGHSDGSLKLKQVTHVSMGPDDNKTLPDELKWMEKRVRSMQLRGNQLHNIDFLVKDQLLPYIILDEIEISFSYDIKGEKGSFVVLLGFSGFLKSRNLSSEFEMSITRISLTTAQGTKKASTKKAFNRNRTEGDILKLLDTLKTSIFD